MKNLIRFALLMLFAVSARAATVPLGGVTIYSVPDMTYLLGTDATGTNVVRGSLAALINRPEFVTPLANFTNELAAQGATLSAHTASLAAHDSTLASQAATLSTHDSSISAQSAQITALLSGATIWVDPVNGNDATATRANASLKFKTLASALTNAVSGDTIVCLPGTNYVRSRFAIEEGIPQLNLRDKSNVVVFSYPPRGFHVVATNMGDTFLLSNAPNSLIEGVVFNGWRTNASAVSPVSGSNIWTVIRVLGGNEGTVFRNLRLENIMNHGIGVYGGDSTSSTNILIEGCYFAKAGYHMTVANGHAEDRYDGSAVACDEGWIIQNNVIDECSNGVEPYPHNAGAGLGRYPVIIRGNLMRNCLIGVSTSGATWFGEISDNVIMTSTNYVRTFDGESHSTWVSTVAFTGSALNFQQNTSGLNIKNNTIIGYDIGIEFDGGSCSNVLIEANILRNIRRYGIAIGVDGAPNYYRHFRIINNTVDTTGERPFYLASIRDSFVTHNTLKNIGVLAAGPVHGIFITGDAGAWPSNNFVAYNSVIGGSVAYGYVLFDGAEKTWLVANVTNLATFVNAPYYTTDSTNTVLVEAHIAASGGGGTNMIVKTNGTVVSTTTDTINFINGANTVVTGLVAGGVATIGVNSTAGAGSQTPWATAIDGNGQSLTGADTIQANQLVGGGTGLTNYGPTARGGYPAGNWIAIVEGDSQSTQPVGQTYGWWLTNSPATADHPRMWQNTGWTSMRWLTNTAVAGEYMIDLWNEYTAEVRPWLVAYNGSGTNVLLILQTGNHSLVSGTNVYANLALLSNYIARARTDGGSGVKVLVFTLHFYAGEASDVMRRKTEYNQRLREVDFIDYLYDFGDDFILPEQTLSSDGIHPNANGTDHIAMGVDRTIRGGPKNPWPQVGYARTRATFSGAGAMDGITVTTRFKDSTNPGIDIFNDTDDAAHFAFKALLDSGHIYYYHGNGTPISRIEINTNSVWLKTNTFISGNLGVGLSLTVTGQTETATFKMATGAGSGKVLTSDGSGVGTWATATGGSGGDVEQLIIDGETINLSRSENWDYLVNSEFISSGSSFSTVGTIDREPWAINVPGTGGFVTTLGESGHPGLYTQFVSNLNDRATIYIGQSTAALIGFIPTNTPFWIVATVQQQSLSDGTDNANFKIGLMDRVDGVECTNSIVFQTSNNVWQAVSQRASAKTVITSVSNVLGTAYYTLAIGYDGSNAVRYAVGGSKLALTAVATNSGADVPHFAAMGPAIMLNKFANGTTALRMTNKVDSYKLVFRRQ